jgi:hypothetical protein
MTVWLFWSIFEEAGENGPDLFWGTVYDVEGASYAQQHLVKGM